MQRVLAIARLTWKAAFRFRLFWVIAGLLLLSVLVLPLLLRHDGTARGFTQILLTYTLSLITTLLGFATLWLACGTLARDIEESQIQMVAVKPIARWQIWLGKWLGIVALNAVLLGITGGCVYALLLWRAQSLSPVQRGILKNEIFTARGSLREPVPDVDAMVERTFQAALKEKPVPPEEQPSLRQFIREQIKAVQENVPPNHLRRWEIDVGLKRHLLKDQPMFFRFQFHPADTNATGLYTGVWKIGPPEAPFHNSGPKSFPGNSVQEFYLPSNSWDDKGMLIVEFENRSEVSLLFPLESGFEVLYRESTFGLNYARGLGIILCWLSLVGAVGLAAASLLSFPVAAFCTVSLLIVVMSSGTMSSTVEEGAVFSRDHEGNFTAGLAAWADVFILWFFRATLFVLSPVQTFSPVDALGSGRSIAWGQLGLAFVQIVVVMGGAFTCAGMWFLSRRELAATQSNQ